MQTTSQPVSSHNIPVKYVQARGFTSSLAHDIAQAYAARRIASFNWTR